MKVLHLIDSGGLYGAEAMLLGLLAEQKKAGLKSVLGSIGRKKEGGKPIEAAALTRGLDCRKFRFSSGPNLPGAFDILRFARQQKFDLLHSHGYKANILFGFLPRTLRKFPVVATLHGWTSTGQETKLRLYEWLDGRSLPHLDAVVLVSNSMLSHHRLRNCNPSRVHVVQNGIPVSAKCSMNLKSSSANGLDPSVAAFCQSGMTIGSIGRLSPEKGYLGLLKAVGMLVNAGLDVRLALLGDGPQKSELETEARRLGISSRMLLPGYCSSAADYLPMFDVFVLPSQTECLPISILEAMRAGVPIVASRVGGIPEILRDGEAGILIDPRNTSELATSIYKLASDEQLRRRLAEQVRTIVCKCYTSEVMAAKYQDIYSSLFM